MSKIAGKDASFTISATAVPVFDLTLDVEAGEIDVTDVESTDDWREFLAGFKSGSLSFSQYLDDTVLPIVPGVTVPFVATFGAYSMTGNCVILTRGIPIAIDDAVKIDVTGRITGAPVEVIT